VFCQKIILVPSDGVIFISLYGDIQRIGNPCPCPDIQHQELQNVMGQAGRLCQMIVILLIRNHVSVCNGNTMANPKHVSALKCNFMATIIIIKIKHVIIYIS